MVEKSDDLRKVPSPDFTRGLHGAGNLKPENVKPQQQEQQQGKDKNK
jgi:hypothetical protein